MNVGTGKNHWSAIKIYIQTLKNIGVHTETLSISLVIEDMDGFIYVEDTKWMNSFFSILQQQFLPFHASIYSIFCFYISRPFSIYLSVQFCTQIYELCFKVVIAIAPNESVWQQCGVVCLCAVLKVENI